MTTHCLDAQPIDVQAFVALSRSRDRFIFSEAVLGRLAADRKVVQSYLDAGTPAYGLNTGLGGNLGYRVAPGEALAFQEQVILGRMIGMGEPLPQEVVRAGLLARVLGLAQGGSGVSVDAAQALLALLDRGVTPVVPMQGSISSGDLGLCAHLVAPLIGQGEAYVGGRRMPGAQALAALGLAPTRLQAKDALGLINASSLTAAYAALVGQAVREHLLLAAAVAALSNEGYAANLSIFDPRIAAARPAGRQVAAAALFRALLADSSLHDQPPRAVQDALSFRVLAPVFGSTLDMLALLLDAVATEINGCSASPLVFAREGDMLSTPNFHPPMLALAFDAMAIALTHLSAAAVQRVIKLQTPHLSALPRYLSPEGGASVGFNALQKTAAALHAEIRLKATPASLDAVVVSDTVEDHATHAMLCVRKLEEQLRLLRQLVALEALVAAQAVSLRGECALGAGTQLVFNAVRAVVPALAGDRPCGPDAMTVHGALFSGQLHAALYDAVGDGMMSRPLRTP